MRKPEAYCDCRGPPWQPMTQLHVGGLDRWHVCRQCATVKQEVCNPDGTIASVVYHRLDDGRLSQTVIGEARVVLDQMESEQLSLWGEE